ncbi:MAG: agmatinase family protein [Lentimicrobiaceae bacterium]|jgi:agmatinase
MDLHDKIAAFDPNGIGDQDGNIYGLPFDTSEAKLVILPVPWEVTVSYQGGTALAPEAILQASYQVDLFDPFVADAWKLGIAMQEINKEIKEKSNLLRLEAEDYIQQLSKGFNPEENAALLDTRNKINLSGKELNLWVKNESIKLMDQNKIVALLGGDHSTPLGLMQALAEKHSSFGILHIDAHADLREAYEGFEYSHASIMFNAIKIPQITRLVQVGIRDYCEAELNLIHSDKRISAFFERDIKHRQFEGTTWASICDQIIDTLPEKVYLSFDIDGLDPKLCPNTGTPVPGGLEMEQALYLVEKLVNSGRKIIGFDLNEVAPGDDEWDANVGARLLYRLANMCMVSNQ